MLYESLSSSSQRVLFALDLQAVFYAVLVELVLNLRAKFFFVFIFDLIGHFYIAPYTESRNNEHCRSNLPMLVTACGICTRILGNFTGLFLYPLGDFTVPPLFVCLLFLQLI